MVTICLFSLLVLMLIGLLILVRPRLGLIVSLLASAGLFFWGVVEESLLIVCLSPLLLMAILVLVITIKILRQQPVLMHRRGFRWRWVLGIPALVLLVQGLWISHSPWLVLLLWLVVAWIVSAAIVGSTSHTWTVLQVFSLLGTTMRQNLPLAVALENAACGRKDYLGSVLWEIHAWLVQGYSLAEALERGFPQCPRHLLARVKVAQKSEQLPQVFASIERDLLAGLRWRNLVDADPGPYPLVILVIMYLQVLGVFTLVMPQTYAVYTFLLGSAENWPWPTRVMMDLRIADFGFIPLMGFILAGVVVTQLIKWLRPRSWSSRGWLGSWADRFRWMVPGVGGIERTLAMLQVTSALRLGLQGGQTIDRAVGYTLGLDVNSVLKRRLKRWHAAIVSGANVAQAARRCHLGRPLAWAFDADLNGGHTPIVLQSLEELLRARHRYLRVVMRSILNPCVIIGLALLVGFVVVAIFWPGIRVIEIMTGLVYP